MRVERFSFGSFPAASFQAAESKQQGQKRFERVDSISSDVEASRRRKPDNDAVNADPIAVENEKPRSQPGPNALDAYVYVGEHARRGNPAPHIARAIATYEHLAQLPQREQFVSMFGIDAYA